MYNKSLSFYIYCLWFCSLLLNRTNIITGICHLSKHFKALEWDGQGREERKKERTKERKKKNKKDLFYFVLTLRWLQSDCISQNSPLKRSNQRKEYFAICWEKQKDYIKIGIHWFVLYFNFVLLLAGIEIEPQFFKSTPMFFVQRTFR